MPLHVICCATIFLGLACSNEQTPEKALQDYQDYRLKTSGAGEALDAWSFERSYPSGRMDMQRFQSEALKFINQRKSYARDEQDWEPLGPYNQGGRTLCLAFHPTDTNVLFAGSASGGLWKSTTQGIGQNAWEYVPTGFPILGVSAIAIDRDNPQIMFIGTGEGYNAFGLAEPGTINRFTRGTYGMGILRSTDGGASWSQVLAFDGRDVVVVKDIEIGQQSKEIFAGTTRGLFKSTDQGEHWNQIFSQGPIIDVEIDPLDNERIYFSQGNLNLSLDPDQVGIFKSENGGETIRELTGTGLVNAWSGSAKLSIHPIDNSMLFASIQVGWFNNGSTTPVGLYKSTDFGETWQQINNTNVAFWQGWYSHDVALHPNDTSQLIYVGLDAWRSESGGDTINKVSDWRLSSFGKIPVDSASTSSYVHADIHGAVYHPLVPDLIFLFGDGGFFSSADGGLTYTDRNGGYQTTQFYANFSNSMQDPNFAIGGAQDNSTYIYHGAESWSVAIGGDGMSAAINPLNDQIVYASAQGLFLARSLDRADSFALIPPTLDSAEIPPFSAPYELAPSRPSTIYAGAQSIYKSEDGGDSWYKPASGLIDEGNFVTNIAVAPNDPNLLYIATAPNPFSGALTAKLMKSIDGGSSWDQMSGLPNLIIKDIAIDPIDDAIVYIVFSGFGAPHVFKSIDGGENWKASSEGLPDVPTNTVLIDDQNNEHLYLGNDIGVYHSSNAGDGWQPLPSGLLDAAMVIHLSISPANRKLRIATHGNGVYQRDLIFEPSVAIDNKSLTTIDWRVEPNPFDDELNILLNNSEVEILRIDLFDATGRNIHSLLDEKVSGHKNLRISATQLNLIPGIYFLKAYAKKHHSILRVIKS